MEYTKSVDKNGEVFEVFTGTPEEIAKLIKLKSTHINYIEFEQQMEKVRKLAEKCPAPIVSDATINTPAPEGPSLEKLNKKIAEQVHKGFENITKQAMINK